MIRAARTALEVGMGPRTIKPRNARGVREPPTLSPALPRLVDGGILNPLSLLRPLDGWLRGYFGTLE